MRRHLCGVAPRTGAEQTGHPEVDHPESAVVTEHELARCELGVDQALLVCRVERPTGFESDDERLRRFEQTTPVTQIAEAAATEVLDDPEDGRTAVEIDRTPIDDRRHVRMRDRRRQFGDAFEHPAELVVLGEDRLDDLDGDGQGRLFVEGIGDDRVGARGNDVGDAESFGDHPTFERAEPPAGSVGRIGVHQAKTLSPDRPLLGAAGGPA